MSAKLNPKKIGENLKRLIKESEYKTQAAFAKAYAHEYKLSNKSRNVDARTVRRWVKDGMTKIDDIADAAKTLNVDVRALLF
jgi:AraC-like DNA-binding protein